MYFVRAYDHEDHRYRTDYRGQTVVPSFTLECQEDHSCYLEGCQRVVINVSGEVFETQLKTLNRYPNTLLGNEAKRLAYWDRARCHFFFDRHRLSFPAILNFYQTGGKLRKPHEVPEEIFYDELKFFEIDESVIRDFLLTEGYTMQTVRTVAQTNWRTRLFSAFEYPDSSLFARTVAMFNVAVIALSIALFCLETLPAKSSPKCPTLVSAKQQGQYQTLVAPVPTTTPIQISQPSKTYGFNWFFILETLCVLWFSFEFAIRLVTYPFPRKAFMLSLANWLDLASILPFIGSTIILHFTVDCYDQCQKGSIFLNLLRFLRVFRIFKFYKYVTGMKILARTLRMSFREMTMFILFLTICIVLFATAIYFAETGNDRLQFNSIPDSFWWAIISMCTVGYGDYVPRSLPGKLVGSICVVAGVMTIALPVPVIVTNFNIVYRQTLQKRFRPELTREKQIPPNQSIVIMSQENAPIKIDKWDGNALKNALDDAAKKIMNESYGLVESFKLIDGRLALCSIAVSCSLFALLWDFLYPFPASKTVLIICVACYFILTGVISVYLLYFEGGVFYVGLEKDKAGIDPDDKWTLQSSLKKYDDQYCLKITYTGGVSKQTRSVERVCSVTEFFDEEGTLCYDLYEATVKGLKDSLSADKKAK
uniref:Signal peptidase complex subunit 2 n=2 Tax=Macrostomum lignano TaxID=282301 RepID=A0A1I8HIG7_9PLAT